MNLQTPHEKFCLATATHFTAVRGRIAAGTRTKETFACIDAAIKYAEGHGDGRTMIYAVNGLGNSAHICNA
jgi:hypothetical protein